MFLRGLLIGFAIAAPVGPIGVLCIRRTLAEGRAAGLVTGLGAATADAFYGAVAACGLTVISGVLLDNQFWLGLLGGLFLMYLGIRMFHARPATCEGSATSNGLVRAFLSTFVLTITNPATILSFAAIFAGAGIADKHSSAGLLVSGVFLGSAIWWLILSIMTGFLRRNLDSHRLLWINRMSGLVIGGFGFVVLLRSFGE